MNGKILLGALVAANVVSGLLIVRDRHEHRQACVALSKRLALLKRLAKV